MCECIVVNAIFRASKTSQSQLHHNFLCCMFLHGYIRVGQSPLHKLLTFVGIIS